jgi:hypothetical protein
MANGYNAARIRGNNNVQIYQTERIEAKRTSHEYRDNSSDKPGVPDLIKIFIQLAFAI